MSTTMNRYHLAHAISCTECRFTTVDLKLMEHHSCEIQEQGGTCEDYPCCGHEWGDCNGLKYGSDEAIKNDPHILCDHENGECSVLDEEADRDDVTEEEVMEEW